MLSANKNIFCLYRQKMFLHSCLELVFVRIKTVLQIGIGQLFSMPNVKSIQPNKKIIPITQKTINAPIISLLSLHYCITYF